MIIIYIYIIIIYTLYIKIIKMFLSVTLWHDVQGCLVNKFIWLLRASGQTALPWHTRALCTFGHLLFS